MKIFFARHGQYLDPTNIVPFRLPGFTLTQLGREQAIVTAGKLAGFNIRTLSTSPIERCLETAKIISESIHLHPNIKNELIETGSPLEGEKRTSKFDFVYDLEEHIKGEGETTDAIFERMRQFVESLKKMSMKSNHVIVSHGDPIDIYLIGLLKGHVPHTREELKNSGIRNIPMGGLIMIEFTKNSSPKYSEIV